MEKKVDIFLIFVLNVLQVQKAISYHPKQVHLAMKKLLKKL